VNYFTNPGYTGGRCAVCDLLRVATMADKGRRFPLLRSAKLLQQNVNQSAPAAAAAYTLVGGIILFGAIGYALDRWLASDPWFLVGGLLSGMIVGFYELVKTTWRK
jgi:F0F1-type ATP synthase assembly protein I